MTITKRSPRASRNRVSCGAYQQDDVGHELVAIRDDTSPWRLVDVTDAGQVLIEAFAADEELDAVRAVAEMYLGEMTS